MGIRHFTYGDGAEFTARARQSKDLHEKIDGRFMHMLEKMEEMKGELLVAGQRRGKEIHDRINDVSELVARVDERTKS